MKKFLLLLTLSTSFLLANAQVPVYRWAGKIAGTGNDYGDNIQTDALGNVYVAGRFDGTCDFDPSTGISNKTSTGSSDAYIAKYTNLGSLIWVVSFGGTGADRIYSIDVDAAGNVYATGNYSLTIDVDPGPGLANFTSIGGLDVFIAKFNSTGNLVWANTIGEANTEIAESIALDASGSVYVGGEFSSPSLDLNPGAGSLLVNNGNTTVTYDPYLIKLDTAGTFQWGFNLQGLSSDYIKSVTVDANDNVVVGGYFYTTMNIDPIGGTSLTSLGSADCFLARYTSAGSYDWSTKFGGTLLDNIFSITTSATSIYATGTFNSVVDFNPGVDTFNIQSKGSTDIFIISFSNSGAFNWAGGIGGTVADNSNYILSNTNGDVFVAGSFQDSADFDPSNVNIFTKAYGVRDGFLAKYDNNGAFRWVQKIGSAGTDYVRSVAIDPTDNEIICSGYWTTGTLNLDPTNLSINLPNTGLNDAFFAKYGECEYPIVTTQPVTTGACIGSNASFIIAATGLNLTLQWQEGTNGGTTWTNIVDGGVYAGATTNTLSLTGLTAPFNNRFYRCISNSSCGLSTTSGVGILFVGTVDTSLTINTNILVANQVSATYQWLDCNNNFAPIPGATAKQFIASVPGTYALSVTKNGCTDTSACYSVTTIGVNELEAGVHVKIYPVPATNEIFLELSKAGNYSAALYDVTGRQLLSNQFTFDRIARLQVAELESGIYLVGIRNNKGSDSFFRVVIE